MGIVSLITSVIAIILSLINLIYLFITNMKKIDFNIRNYTYIKELAPDNPFFYLFNVEFINKSRQPISITSVKFVENNKLYYVDLEPQRVVDKNKTVGRNVIERKNLDSAEFPINLTALTAVRKILVVHGKEDFQNKEIKVIINTNRGKVFKKINICEKYSIISDFTKMIGF